MKKRRQRSAIIAVLLLGFLIFGAVYFAWSNAVDIFQPKTTDQGTTTVVEIHQGDTSLTIANELQAKGLIRNALAFRIWARFKGLDTELKSGCYELSSSMTIDEMISVIRQGKPIEVPVTIQEGWRLEQIATQFAHTLEQIATQIPHTNENNTCYLQYKMQDFLQYTKHPNLFPEKNNYPFLQSIPPGDSMEGLLFPDTYSIPVNATADDVINIMLTEFNNQVQQNHLDVVAKQHKLTLYQMVILASIVEREVRFAEDRPRVASVYWNRMYKPNYETQGLLDADPTVQYARDSQPGTTSYWTPLQDSGSNIVPDSAWNTYKHTGLPPTPICSAGLASLQAAASPDNTGYYYFYAAKKDGHNIYAKTYAEFQMEMQQNPPQ